LTHLIESFDTQFKYHNFFEHVINCDVTMKEYTIKEGHYPVLYWAILCNWWRKIITLPNVYPLP
jgi:hypothetical protein